MKSKRFVFGGLSKGAYMTTIFFRDRLGNRTTEADSKFVEIIEKNSLGEDLMRFYETGPNDPLEPPSILD